MNAAKITIIILLSLGLATVSAAQQQELGNQTTTERTVPDITAPGDTFYGFKRMGERISLAMARAPLIGGPDREARVLSQHADRRLKEAQILLERNDTEGAEKAIERYSNTIGRAQKRAEASSNNETREMVAKRARNNQEVLQRVSRNVPEQARQGIENALQNSRRVQNALGNNVSDDSEDNSQNKTASDSPFRPPGDRAEGNSLRGGSDERSGERSESSDSPLSSENETETSEGGGSGDTSESPFKSPNSDDETNTSDEDSENTEFNSP